MKMKRELRQKRKKRSSITSRRKWSSSVWRSIGEMHFCSLCVLEIPFDYFFVSCCALGRFETSAWICLKHCSFTRTLGILMTRNNVSFDFKWWVSDSQLLIMWGDICRLTLGRGGAGDVWFHRNPSVLWAGAIDLFSLINESVFLECF